MSANKKNRLEILNFYAAELDRLLIGRGWVPAGPCPFSACENLNSFSLDLGTGAFACLSCGVSGDDAVDFKAALSGVSRATAIENLAHVWGLQPDDFFRRNHEPD